MEPGTAVQKERTFDMNTYPVDLVADLADGFVFVVRRTLRAARLVLRVELLFDGAVQRGAGFPAADGCRVHARAEGALVLAHCFAGLAHYDA